MSSKCALVKALKDQQTKPVNLNKSKICGTTQLVFGRNGAPVEF
jgi:hypothetical protein